MVANLATQQVSLNKLFCMKKRKRRALIVLGLLAAGGLVCALFITIGGLVEDPSKRDIALVLGNKVNEDGTPSARLAARLDRAITLYNEGRCTFIVVSGGTGIEGHDEAKVMERYLVDHNIPGDHVIPDSDGLNTWKSAVNAQRIVNSIGVADPSVVAVSQYFHLPRCRLSLKRAGFSDVSSSYARFVELRDIYSIAREIPAYLKYLLLKRTVAEQAASH